MNKNYFHSLPSVLELPEWKLRLVLESEKVGKVEMYCCLLKLLVKFSLLPF